VNHCPTRSGLDWVGEYWTRSASRNGRNWSLDFKTDWAGACGIAGSACLEEQYSTLTEPGSDTGPPTLQELITNLVVHNAYHFGRIVLLRQMLGNWPPGGGDTW
jgi:hypothetical protein